MEESTGQGAQAPRQRRPGWGRLVSGSLARLALALALASGAMLAACSPTYDWRDAPSSSDFRVQLPAKPATMTRPIHLEDVAVDMTMVGARVGETAFTVAVVPAPAIDPAAPAVAEDRFVRMMREQMLRNVGAPPDTPARPLRVPLVDDGGRRVGDLPAVAIEIQGSGPHAGSRLLGLFVRGADRAFQALVLGPPVDAAQSDHFFKSFQVVRR